MRLQAEQADIDARRAHVAAEFGPALAIAALYGSHDTVGAIRIVCLLLVLSMAPSVCCWS
jgi:hypothetical protein